MTSISLKRLFTVLFTVLLSISFVTAQAQPTARDNPNVMAQIKSVLSSKGLNEQEVKERLKSKGLNIDAMSDAEIAQNRSVIEQTIAELETEKKNAKADNKVAPGTPVVVDPAGPAKTVDPTGGTVTTNSTESTAKEPITTKAEAVADAMQKAIVQKAPEVGIYGHDIFTNQTLEAFRTTDGARTPDTYILGAGDRIRITIFGMSQSDLLLEINKEGYIQPTGLKQLYLQGVSLGEARKLIGQRFSAAYRFQQDQYAVTLQTARAITVNVFGEANLRGSFNMSALNTAFNALAVAGGPTMQGSVRNIELIRGKTRKKMDVYAFLNDPAFQFQFDIQQNDILYVPMAQKIVSLEGAVKRPMKYELAGKEGLAELLGFAGGVNFNTYVEFVQIQRAQADSVVLLEYKLADVLSGKLIISLNDGDVVSIRAAAKPLERFTEISGAVYYPGRYELKDKMTLAALLQRVQLTPEAFTSVYFVERSLRDGTTQIIKVESNQVAGFQLEIKDKVKVFDKALFVNQENVEIAGAVRQPLIRSLSYGDKLPLTDVLQLAGGLLPTAMENAQITRRDLFNPEKIEYISINISQPGNFNLQAGDKLMVFDKRTFVLNSTITLGGAVKAPITVNYNQKLTIADLMMMGGGYTKSSDLTHVDVFRLGYGDAGAGFTKFTIELDSNYKVVGPSPSFMLLPYDQIIVRDLPMFKLDRTIQLNGQVRYPGLYELEAKQVHLSTIIDQAGGFSPLADKRHALLVRNEGAKGVIGVNLKKAMQKKGSDKYDPVLLAGDVITIPQYQNTIGIRLQGTREADLLMSGVRLDGKSLSTVSSFIYTNPRNARWYIREYTGGFAKKADRNSVTVSYPDGSVRGTKKFFLFFRNYPGVKPGAIVSLTNKAEKIKDKDEKGADWDKIFTKILAVGTTMAVLITATK
jgi:protein involved in polysaccharide export with SLBB domain